MIRRGPRPNNGFLMIRNEVVRDARLSYRASGLLTDLLSRPDNWETSAERLAGARPDHEGVKAILTALRELEAAGYLVRRRYKRRDGRFAWEQVVYDTPQDVSAGHATSPSRQDGEGLVAPSAPKHVSAGHATSPSPPGGSSRSKEDLEEDQEDLEEDDLDGAAPRSARGGATVEEQETVTAEEINDWRMEDRARFVQILGDRIVSRGHDNWNEGVFDSRKFYDPLRTLPGKPIRWPGRFFEFLDDTNPVSGVDDWLRTQGLERVGV